MHPIHIRDLPIKLPSQCIYLFSEGSLHCYVGRTLKQNLKKRLSQHSASWAQHNQAVFAFKLACETINAKPGYTKETSRKSICLNPLFPQAFAAGKDRIRQMELRYVIEGDPLRQALLEIYVAVVLKTRYNDFETH
jgi:hypothetical protein